MTITFSKTKLAKKIKMKVSAKTDENYINIDMGCIKALDMFKFFHSLTSDALTKTLSDSECVRLKTYKLERCKGIFPYEWIDSVDKLNTELTPKDAVYSKLKQSGITDEEYQRVLGCWSESGCESIKDYMMVYLKTDVLLSVDVFEKFKEIKTK